MKQIMLTISYDGTHYYGWQKQSKLPTIQEELEKACKKLFGHDVSIKGSGRTDAGVHAKGQCASLKVNTPIPAEKMPRSLNNILPKDIVVLDAKLVGEEFHPQYFAKRKTYIYKVINSKYPVPQLWNYTYFVYTPLDVEAMNKGARNFIGTHDFKAFCSSKNTKKDTIRSIYSFEIKRDGDIITFEVCGNGFLHNMVRIMVGTLIEVGKGDMKPDDIRQIILSKNRLKAGITVPASGLTMYRVDY